MKKSSDHRWCEQKKKFLQRIFPVYYRHPVNIFHPSSADVAFVQNIFLTENIAFNHGIMLEFCEVEGRVT